MRLFCALYYTFASAVYILALPFLLFLSRKQRYKESIPARFFLKQNSSFSKSGIWFHACSLGEVKSIRPIVELLGDEHVNISTITQTGMDEARKYKKEARFLPFEIFLPFWAVKNRALVVMEAELWFMLFYVAKKLGMKTILLNARISDKSYKGYLRFAFFYRKIFANIDLVFAQSEKDRERLLQLGAKHVENIGNIKMLSTPEVTKQFEKPECFTVVGASTHVSEELLILDAFQSLSDNAKLIIAPRHPERFETVFEEIEEFAKKKNLSYSRFSEVNTFKADIILLDVLGELVNTYAIADLVILGGAFANVGGHNPLEPAYFGCKLISGINIYNQFALFEKVENYVLTDEKNLTEILKNHHELQGAYIKKIDTFDRVFEALKKGD